MWGSITALDCPWPTPAKRAKRLREHVMQAVAGAVDRVARQQRGERQRIAVGLGVRIRVHARVGGADQAGGLGAGERRDRARAPRRRPLGGVAQCVGGARGQPGGRLGRAQGRVVDDDRGPHAGQRGIGAGGTAVAPGHLRGAQRRRDRRDAWTLATGRTRRGERLGRVDDAAAAERDDQRTRVDGVEQLAREYVHASPCDLVHGAGAFGDGRGHRRRARRRQQRVAAGQ